jgi:hypothetical protein
MNWLSAPYFYNRPRPQSIEKKIQNDGSNFELDPFSPAIDVLD